MQDMLVRLYDLPDGTAARARMAAAGVVLRRPLTAERPPLRAWVEARFGGVWAAEIDAALSRTPAPCIIAIRERQVLGFACWDVVALGLFGPTGVDPAEQGAGIGTALLVAALHAMHVQGYAYAVIAGVGPADFYARAVGAVPIAGSTPGLFGGLVRGGDAAP